MLTNTSKTIVWRAENLAFDRKVATTSIGDYNLGFPGQYYDAEGASWQNWFRTYDGSVGRYTQSDPIGLAGGLNTYAYALGNPIQYIDPLGLYCLTAEQIQAMAGGLGGLVGGGVSGAISGSALGPKGAVAGGVLGAVRGGAAGAAGGLATTSVGTVGAGIVSGMPGGVTGMAGGAVAGSFGGGATGGVVGGLIGGIASVPAGVAGGFIGGLVGRGVEAILTQFNDCDTKCDR